MLNVFVKKSAKERYVHLFDGQMMPLEDLVSDYERLLKASISESENDKTITELEVNLFVKEFTEELYVYVFDGQMMPLEDLVSDYERLLKAIISEPENDKKITELKVGEWFRIDRAVINKSKEKIRYKCNKAGREGKAYWKRFEKSNKIADENPEQYSSLIETYIFEHEWKYMTEGEMRDICKKIGDGMCDEVICDLELQMRICNGESVEDLFKKADKLPYARLIKLRSRNPETCAYEENGYFGGGAACNFRASPAHLCNLDYNSNTKNYRNVPYAFRNVLS